VIIGHSERRQFFGETDQTVNSKVQAALRAGLKPILCVGETLQQREAGKTLPVVREQLLGGLTGLAADRMAAVTIAYEPVWAIGTGKVATPQQAQEVHASLRGVLVERFGAAVAGQLRLQYGGSVKPGNVKELMAQEDIDGALVGGASLEKDSFAAILRFRG
jgi:triosephosphate isomerase